LEADFGAGGGVLLAAVEVVLDLLWWAFAGAALVVAGAALVVAGAALVVAGAALVVAGAALVVAGAVAFALLVPAAGEV